MPLGRAGPSAFCLVLAAWGHVIPLDLSPAGLDRRPIPSDIDRGELFLREAGLVGGLFTPSAYLSLSLLERGRIDFVILSMISNQTCESRFVYFLLVANKYLSRDDITHTGINSLHTFGWLPNS